MNTHISFQRRLLSHGPYERFNELMRIITQQMLQMVMEAEIQWYLERANRHAKPQKRRLVVRNGYHKPRPVRVCSGIIRVRVPRTRNRAYSTGTFSSRIVQRYTRRNLVFDEMTPLAYCYGIARGNMKRALTMLLDQVGAGYSINAAEELLKKCGELLRLWKNRDLSAKQYTCLWAEHIREQGTIDGDPRLLLIIAGADNKGKKELLDVCDYRRILKDGGFSALYNLASRGFKKPEVVITEKAAEIKGAVRKCFPGAHIIKLT